MAVLPKLIDEIINQGFTINKRGEKKQLDDAVSKGEAESIVKAMESVNAKYTLETGVAAGVSTLAITSTLKSLGGVKHYGVDPNQTDYYGSAAILNLEKENLQDMFQLLEGPSHTQLAKLIEQNVQVDFVLIDGWHTFDYTLLDFFLADKLLRPGGIVAFHDCYGLSKQKVLKYVETHRKYEYAEEFFVRGNESRKTTLKFFIWRILNKPAFLFSKYHWKYQIRNSSGLVFMRKKEQYEPPYDFYKTF